MRCFRVLFRFLGRRINLFYKDFTFKNKFHRPTTPLPKYQITIHQFLAVWLHCLLWAHKDPLAMHRPESNSFCGFWWIGWLHVIVIMRLPVYQNSQFSSHNIRQPPSIIWITERNRKWAPGGIILLVWLIMKLMVNHACYCFGWNSMHCSRS